MRIMVTAAALALFTYPAFAQDVTISDATEALIAIKADEAKQKAYCEMQQLYDKAGEAEEAKKGADEVQAFVKQAEEKGASIGPDFEKVANFDAEIDPESDEGKKFFEALEALEEACAPSEN